MAGIKQSYGSKRELAFIKGVMDLMLAGKMFHVELPNGLKLQASQYAFVPQPRQSPMAMPPPDPMDEQVLAPFRAWQNKAADETEAPQPFDPLTANDFTTDLPT